VFVVAITAIAKPVEQAALELAPLLGVTAYELRLTLAAGTPALVLTTPDRQRAVGVMGQIRGLGHGAIGCDDAAVVSHSDMLWVKNFRFEADAFVAEVPPGMEERLPYVDVLALLRALHKSRTETRSEVKEKSFSVGRAIASGGLVLRKSATREVVSASDDRGQVLYLFRKSGQRPWLLAEGEAKYTGLGPHLGRTRGENYAKTIELLRAYVPTAVFDDRLLNAKRIPERVTRSPSSKSSATSSATGVDLLAHLLALSIAHS